MEETLYTENKESTRKLYLSNLRKLNGKKEIESLKFLKNTEGILKQISEVENPNTRKNYYICVVSALKEKKGFKKYYDVYHAKMMEINLELNTNPYKTEKTIEKCNIPFSKLEERQKHLISLIDFKVKKKNITTEFLDNLEMLLVTSLYTLLAPRRNLDYTEMEIGKGLNNYSDKKFTFNKYKTADTYNQQIVDVPDELVKIIALSQRVNPSEYLLNKNKRKLTSTEMSKLVKKSFNLDVGSSAIRNIYLSNKYSEFSSDLKEDCTDMGTSVDVALGTYIKTE